MTVQHAIGWAGLFMFLIVGTDIPATAQLAAAFAWLIFFAVVFKYGPDAFNTVSQVSVPSTPPATGSGAGGGARKK